MTLTPLQKSIYNGSVCPYCKCLTKYVDSKVVYGKDTNYGMIYYCQPCFAWVGVHKGTSQALGRLADAKLRRAKSEAHASFDRLWKDGLMTRVEAYAWLAEELDIDPEYCHIGMFKPETCYRVVTLADAQFSTFFK